MEQIVVGMITKPQALKGEFRVKPSILNLKQFKKFKSIFIDNKEYAVEKVTLRDTFVIMKIEGVNSCEMAETFRNKTIYAEMEIDTNDNFDLVGFDIVVDGECIGKIIEINNYGSKDIVTVEGSKSFMFPIIDGLISVTDKDSKKLILDKNIFEQVVWYEN